MEKPQFLEEPNHIIKCYNEALISFALQNVKKGVSGTKTKSTAKRRDENPSWLRTRALTLEKVKRDDNIMASGTDIYIYRLERQHGGLNGEREREREIGRMS